MPISFITATASGLTCPGLVPALSTSKRLACIMTEQPFRHLATSGIAGDRIKTRSFKVYTPISKLIAGRLCCGKTPFLSLQHAAGASQENHAVATKATANCAATNPGPTRLSQ